ncbi:spore germination protein KC [Scopulibacillus daqui]|uniref:Spore germination protein KC n=1 Tax=Scopulibacillus daqui TaxID=1469162 RepID=A0ABS2PVA7_9BACL|nr:Ger(x)C family spore germination protein [Scopulibacillus daqui]MBM7643989.1 spore germination protein KC [Scopulibacillus daqui]
MNQSKVSGNFLFNRLKKYIVMPLSMSLFLLVSSGCWDRVEINDLAIVTGIALDAASHNNIQLSVQLFMPTGAGGGTTQGGGGGSPGGQQQSFVISANGVNIADAVTNIEEKTSRRIFWGQSDTIFFGKKLAKKGIGPSIDFLTRYPKPREHAYVFVAEGKGKKILEYKPHLERNSSEVLRELAKKQTGMKVSLKDLAQMLSDPYESPVLPWVKYRGERARISGIALFSGDKMVGRMNKQTTRGVQWLRNEIRTATITVNPKGKGRVSMYLLRSKSKLQPVIKNGTWEIIARIEAEDDIVQNTTNLDVMDPKVINKLEKDTGYLIKKRINAAVRQAQKKDLDIFGFSDAFHRKYPSVWKTSKDRWKDIFPDVTVKVNTKVKILRPGVTSKSTSKP